jgi:hypothetical protein
MRFEMRRSLGAGAAADADPRTNPELVPDVATMRIPLSLRNTDAPPRRLLIGAEGTAAQAIAIEVWTQDEPEDPGAALDTLPEPGQSAARRFYQATTAPIVFTVGTLREFTLNMPGPGIAYVRVTTAPAAASTLLVAVA